MDKKKKELVELLGQVRLFAQLDKGDLEKLAESASIKLYPRGSMICVKNEPANYFHIVKSGVTNEFVVDDNELSCLARPNERLNFFGELGVLLDGTYYTTSVATEKAEIIRIPKEVFCEVFWAHKEATLALLRLLSERLQISGEKTISFVSFSAEGRLAYMLLRRQNKDHEILTTQENLSEECGIVRQTVSLILNNWKRSNIIEIKRGKIIVLDTDALTDCFFNDRNIR